MNFANNIIERATMTSNTGAAPEAAKHPGTGDQGDPMITLRSPVPVLEWAGTETYAVAVQATAPGDSTAFRLSF